MKILATSTAPFEFEPPPGDEVVFFDPAEPIPAEHLDAEVAIVEGGGGGPGGGAGIRQLVTDAPRLRWIQCLAAGPDGVLKAGFGPQVQITNGRGLHDLTVAEHAVALSLAAATRLPALFGAARERRWAHDEYGAWRPLHDPGHLSTLISSNVLVWGFGAIGQAAARAFAALSANVRGVATSAGERAGFEVVSDADLPDALGWADLLVMVLPATASTTKALNAERLAHLKPTAWVVNVGRGVTVDEDALVAALDAGRLGGAALDVTATEPYPSDGPLWGRDNVIITPHVAGGRAVGSDELINRNLARLKAGEPLENLVER